MREDVVGDDERAPGSSSGPGQSAVAARSHPSARPGNTRSKTSLRSAQRPHAAHSSSDESWPTPRGRPRRTFLLPGGVLLRGLARGRPSSSDELRTRAAVSQTTICEFVDPSIDLALRGGEREEESPRRSAPLSRALPRRARLRRARRGARPPGQRALQGRDRRASASPPTSTTTRRNRHATETGQTGNGRSCGSVIRDPGFEVEARAGGAGQTTTQTSGSHSPSHSWPSSWEQRSSIVAEMFLPRNPADVIVREPRARAASSGCEVRRLAGSSSSATRRRSSPKTRSRTKGALILRQRRLLRLVQREAQRH